MSWFFKLETENTNAELQIDKIPSTFNCIFQHIEKKIVKNNTDWNYINKLLYFKVYKLTV